MDHVIIAAVVHGNRMLRRSARGQREWAPAGWYQHDTILAGS
jgi:hypothetical protein